jgi:hypothetical protein
MSGYQFYEFQTIDQKLSPDDKTYVQSLSSRSKVTATNAQFVYNYGDFSGQPEKILDRCFDLFVHVSSYGVRQLMIRFPKTLIDPKIFEPYCIEHLITVTTTAKSVILDIRIVQDDYCVWLDEEVYAVDLSPLRQEVIQGDLRLLYLAWLAAGFAEEAPDSPEEAIEPPVPATLKTLSPALTLFADIFKIDSDLINAAAIESPLATQQTEPIAEWIAQLSETDRNAYLLRVVQGETLVGAELMQKLRKKFGKKNSAKKTSPGRALEALMSIADDQKNSRDNQAYQAAIVARQKYLKTLAPKADAIWEKVQRLVEFKQSKPYDEAVAHLIELRDLAAMQEDLANFTLKLVKLKEQCNNRSGLLTRLKKADLSS